jgi:hypothetical protein
MILLRLIAQTISLIIHQLARRVGDLRQWLGPHYIATGDALVETSLKSEI